MNALDPVARYCAVLSDLRPDRLDELAALCAETVAFKDPFNDTVGIEPYLSVLRKMFRDVESHSFRVLGRADGVADDKTKCVYLRWVFEARLRTSGLVLRVEGMSEIAVDKDGLIARHVDFWDVGRDFYERLPVLGRLVRWVRRRAAA